MRVRSQAPLYRSIRQKSEMSPKTPQVMKEIKDLEFNIKLCDMGNACYVDRHYSDVI